MQSDVTDWPDVPTPPPAVSQIWYVMWTQNACLTAHICYAVYHAIQHNCPTECKFWLFCLQCGESYVLRLSPPSLILEFLFSLYKDHDVNLIGFASAMICPPPSKLHLWWDSQSGHPKGGTKKRTANMEKLSLTRYTYPDLDKDSIMYSFPGVVW